MNPARFSRKIYVAMMLATFSLVPSWVAAQTPQATPVTPWLGKANGVVVVEAGQPIEVHWSLGVGELVLKQRQIPSIK